MSQAGSHFVMRTYKPEDDILCNVLLSVTTRIYHTFLGAFAKS